MRLFLLCVFLVVVVVVGIVNSVLNVHGFCWLHSKYNIFSTTHRHKTQTFLAIALCLTVFEMLFTQIVRDCCGEFFVLYEINKSRLSGSHLRKW